MTEKLNSSNLRQNPRNVNELVNELTLFDDDLICLIKTSKQRNCCSVSFLEKVKVISVTNEQFRECSRRTL